MNNFELKLIELKDFSQVAGIHKKAFQNSLLSILGDKPIERYYKWQMQIPNKCHAMGCFEKEKMVGFCFSGVFRDSEIGFIQRNWLLLLRQLIMHPRILNQMKLRKRLKYILLSYIKKIIHCKGNQKLLSDEKFGILSVAVDPEYQGLKIGKELVHESEKFARQNNFSKIRLSVHTDNFQAIQFYETQGWKKTKDDSGKWLGLMEKALF